MRIAPLFYAVLAFELTRQFFNGGIQASIQTVIVNLSFSTGFVPFSEIVWAGWSVSVEMMFYAVFPVLIVICRTDRAALLLMLASIVLSYSLRDVLDAKYSATESVSGLNWSYYSFAPNLCFFTMGMFAYRVSQRLTADSAVIRWLIPTTAVSLLIALLVMGVAADLKYGGRLDIILWGLVFTLLVIWQAVAPIRLLANSFLQAVGERSFSIYLLHPIIIFYGKGMLVDIYAATSGYLSTYAYFVCAALTLLAVLAAAEITYRLIEVPGIELGRKWIQISASTGFGGHRHTRGVSAGTVESLVSRRGSTHLALNHRHLPQPRHRANHQHRRCLEFEGLCRLLHTGEVGAAFALLGE
ncbi:peptidoglycan/LPS O-acetylase OafA/YrhL [Pseudomonas sp. TE3786]